ncbi:MAG TPA: hypothetical protein VJG83_05050 [archaeon]|nr:hypothetical protein [archaeon]
MVDYLQESSKKDTVKNQLVQILSKEHPLSLANMHRKIAQKFSSRVSFQGIRKAATMLVDEGVLFRNESKEYEISKKWIFDSKKFFDSLSVSYNTRANSKVFAREFLEGDYGQYRLKSLFELDNFWTDMLLYCAENIGKDEPKSCISYNNIHWWFQINYGNEMTLWKSIINKGIKSTFVCPAGFPINDVAISNYRSIGGKVGKAKSAIYPSNVDVNVIGDHIIQVNYPENIVRKLRDFFKKRDSFLSSELKSLNDIMDIKCDIQFTCMKNPQAASAYREKILANFARK